MHFINTTRNALFLAVKISVFNSQMESNTFGSDFSNDSRLAGCNNRIASGVFFRIIIRFSFHSLRFHIAHHSAI